MRIKILSIFSLAIAAVSCNNDVFVGDFAPDKTEVTVAGDDGIVTVTTGSSAWDGFDLQTERSDVIFSVETDDDDRVKSIECSTEWMGVRATRMAGDRIEIKSLGNFTGRTFNFTLRFYSEWDSHDVKVELTPESKSRIISVDFNLHGYEFYGSENVDIETVRVANSGEENMRWTYDARPPLDMSVEFESWCPYLFDCIDYENQMVEIPTFSDYLLGMNGTMVRFQPGIQNLSLDKWPNSTSALIVPPGIAADVTIGSHYSDIAVDYTLTCENPVTGRVREIWGKARMRQPEFMTVNYVVVTNALHF